jgi:prevent-host-death family protein
MIKIDVSDARRKFASVLEIVQSDERVLLMNHGKIIAAIISPEDLVYLEFHEDREDLEAARAAMLEVIEEGAVSWKGAKKELGLD